MASGGTRTSTEKQMAFDGDAGALLSTLSPSRMHDLALRSDAGDLTAAESLALAILRGGREGEEGVPAMIDAATEEYGHGSYRVPVRVIGDKSRMKVVITPSENVNQEERRHAVQCVVDWVVKEEVNMILMRVGWRVEVYEVAPGEPAGVVVKESPR